MRLVAFDLETTGIDPQKHQVIQIGMLCFEPASGEVVGEFEIDVRHDNYEGDPVALEMNREIIGRMLRDPDHGVRWAPVRQGEATSAREVVCAQLLDWGFSKEYPPHPVGFNVIGFDRAFGFQDILHRRGVELGTFLMRGFNQSWPVSSQQYHAALGIEKAHTALADCRIAMDAYLRATTTTVGRLLPPNY